MIVKVTSYVMDYEIEKIMPSIPGEEFGMICVKLDNGYCGYVSRQDIAKLVWPEIAS